ncbi:MAG TPA: spore germination protein [Symbiobacteriaceae bacterium]|nr:spore germination protein [Symbiobacteriaceae bacterium]
MEQPQQPQPALTGDLDRDLAAFRERLAPCGDFAFREFRAAPPVGARAVLIFSRYTANWATLEQQVLETLMGHVLLQPPAGDRPGLAPELLGLVEAVRQTTPDQALRSVATGESLLLVDGYRQVLVIGTRSLEGRAVTVPTTEDVVRGPREAFVELLELNLRMVRRRLPTLRFRLEQRHIGRETQTEVALIWLDGIADDAQVEEARTRLKGIDMDGVIDTGYIEEMIEDEPYSPFPQIEHTERPDKVAAALLEGRFAILAAGSPYALLAPTQFIHFLQASEDYYERFWLGTFIRWIRLFGFLLALTAPALYVTITSVHQEMIPVGLILRLAGTREGAPLPLFLEALVMEATFEMLREAGLRLPKPIGQAVSIVGGLVIGEAAVRAGVANPITVVVVALTGIASFSIPAYGVAVALRLLRFPLLLIGPVLGLPGIATALMLLLTHMVSMRSFGTPYLAPLAPARYDQWGDVLIRRPWWSMVLRPGPGGRRSRRMVPGLRPQPPERRNPGR